MSRDLKNKVVVISRGAEALGYAVADKFLEQGVKTAILLDDRKEPGIDAAAKLNTKYGSNKAVFIECDITTEVEEITKRIFRFYKVDILFNDAGILEELNPKKTIDINLTAVVDLGLKFWEHMRTDKGGNGGTIINTPTIYGFRVDQFLPVYQASKFALMGFTRSLGHVANYERSGVRVIAMCPGFTTTKVSLLEHPPVIWDSTQDSVFSKFLKTQLSQKVDTAGNAAVEIYQRADSGTAWLIEGGNTVVEIK